MVKNTGHFCVHPFTYTEFHNRGQFLCCPDWNTTKIGEISGSLNDNWNSEEAEDVRNEMRKGNFKNCLPSACPVLNTFLETGTASHTIKPLSELHTVENSRPHRIKICSDRPCNLQCPSCRSELFPNSNSSTERTTVLLENIQKYYGSDLKEIFISGGGDPFYSNPLRDFLINFDNSRFPSLEEIIIHTNGIMLTPKLWNMMSEVHKYIHHIEISIDASTKDTYENKVRLRGKWDTLLDNLNFISTIDTIHSITTSFVTQKDNYKEMEDFVNLCQSIFNGKASLFIQFYKIADWGALPQDILLDKQVWRKEHPEYGEFRKEVEKLKKYENVISNFN